ncbi:hypothetical protein NFI96_000758 [Prochilodus magdalenae]|nr:hypothetical protein NFI96_000758 [Prochilodus magdalenae]
MDQSLIVELHLCESIMEGECTAGGAEELNSEPSATKARAGSLHKHSHGLAEAMEAEQEGLVEHQPLEQDDLNFERWKPKPKPKRTLHEKIGDLKTYLWNPETKEFMGRSGKSWSMTMSPQIHNVHGFDITFNASDRSSWRKYARALEAQLKPYDDTVQERRNIACMQDAYFMQDDLEESAERKACQFKRSWLGPCSGLQEKDFGYSAGKPCILLKMNRILGYLPGQGTPVNVDCGVKKGTSEELGDVEFYPKNIFNLMYYPYYGKLRHVNYTSPLVAVRFPSVHLDTHLHVQCKLNGKGIINDSPTDRFLGSVSFSLEVGA